MTNVTAGFARPATGAFAILMTFAATFSGAQGTNTVARATELKNLSLEELIEIPVISASRVPHPWFTAPMAIDVVPDEEIRRSGVTRLPDVLRYATGLQVARAGGGAYAISARGFNSTFANKLQVMLDGRSLYTPLFSGVFWELHETFLPDLDRIEVVRGPGATLWGPNAVNGVINVISKSAGETQGMLLYGGGGLEEEGFAGIRYGGRLAENSHYRVYVQHQQRDDLALRSGADAGDWFRHTQYGFRTDTDLTDIDELTVQGDAFINAIGSRTVDDQDNTGGNLLARWNRDLGEYGDMRLQAYYDQGRRDVPGQFGENRNTFDVDGQHHFNLGERQNVVWGLTYRLSHDKTSENRRSYRFSPSSRTVELITGYVQDEITIVKDLLKVIPGSKFEFNDVTGFEAQPGVRLALTPHEHHTLWAGASRAVRTATRAEEDLRFSPNPSGVPLTVRGNRNFESEELLAYEAGYRVQFPKAVSLDVAGFHNDYDKLRTQEPSPGPGGFPLVISNEREGEIYGAELAVKWQICDSARLSASYTRMEQDLRLKRRSNDPTGSTTEGNDPTDFAVLHLALNLPHNVEIDLFGRYMDSLPNPYVSSYFAFDARIGWRVTPNVELSIVGQNLTDPQHREFGPRTAPEVERSVFGKATIRF